MSTATDPDLRDVYEENPIDNNDDDGGDGGFDTGETRPSETTFGGSDGFSDADPEKKPERHHKRESLADLFGLAWGGTGTWLERTQKDIPVGRVLQFQAPLAGSRLDNLIKDTFLDVWLQPLARHADKIEGVASLFLFPAMIAAVERNPEIGGVLEPVLRQVIASNLVDMVPVLKKQKAEKVRAAKAMSDLSDVLDYDPKTDGDPVDAIINMIFAGFNDEQ